MGLWFGSTTPCSIARGRHSALSSKFLLPSHVWLGTLAMHTACINDQQMNWGTGVAMAPALLLSPTA
jgi:hypothetical protein